MAGEITIQRILERFKREGKELIELPVRWNGQEYRAIVRCLGFLGREEDFEIRLVKETK